MFKRRWLILIGMIAALSILAAGVIASIGGSSEFETVTVAVPQSAPSTDQTLRLDAFTYERTFNTLGVVTIGVRNVTDRPQSGFVWYLLAPIESREPWRDAVFTAPERPFEVAPGASITFLFDAPERSTIPSGTYHLSAWVHGQNDDGRFHSDGAGAPGSQYLGDPFGLTITEVVSDEQIDGSTAFEVTFEAINQSPQDRRVSVNFEVLPDDGGAPPSFVHTGTTALLSAGERWTATLRGSSQLESGHYSVRALLRDGDDHPIGSTLLLDAFEVD